jgi:xylulokinase
MNCYLGLDIGTSGCKAVIFNENGLQLSSAFKNYDIISRHSGWAELDSNHVIEKCFDVIKESVSFVDAVSVRGLGISSQGEAFTLLDKKGKTLYNAIVSSDIRALEYANTWAEEFGKDKLYQITGHTPHPMFSLFKLLWIKDNLPEIWSRTSRIFCFEDLLQYRLGISDPTLGWSLAGRTMLFDVVNHCWDKKILDAAGIRENQLARPLQSGIISGYISKDKARELGLPAGTFVVTGGHDQPCSALGAGAIEPGVAVYSIGTVDCITPAFVKPVFSDSLKKSNLCTYDHAFPGLYATVAFSLTGCNIINWFMNEFGRPELEQAKNSNCSPYDILLGKLTHDPSSLLVLPYFTPSGTPYFDASVKGTIFGLDLNTKREDILKALLEGVAFEMRLNLEILEQSGIHVRELRATGGGARSNFLNQLKADVIGKPIVSLNITEAGCMGVAMLVMAADKMDSIKDISKKWIHPLAIMKPDPELSYDKLYQSYKQLYPKLKNDFYQ